MGFLELISVNSKNREISICKEMTKINEAVFRGNAKNLIDKIITNKISLRGEFTLVIGNEETNYKKSDHIDHRMGYIEGAGQLCSRCNYNEKFIKRMHY